MDFIVYVLFGLAFVIRVSLFFYKIEREPDFYSDELTHIGIEKIFIISNNKSNISDYLKKHFYFTSYIGYPTLYHQIIHKISSNYGLKIRRRLSNFFGLLVPFSFIIIFFNNFDITTLLFVGCYMLVSLNSFGLFGKMYVSYTERPFVDFIVFLAFAFFYKYLLTNQLIFLLLSIIPLSIIWFSSKFGIQAIVFISLVYTVISEDNSLFLVVLLSYIIGLLVNKERFLNVQKSHFGHLLWYARNSGWLDLKIKLNGFNMKNLYLYITSFHLFGKLLQFIPMFIFILLFLLIESSNETLNYFILSAFIVSIFTAFKPFLFIGPSYRYSWYFLPFALSSFYEAYPIFSIIFLIIEMILSIFIFYNIMHNKSDNIYAEYCKMLSSIQLKQKNILFSPIRIADMHLAITNKLESKLFAFWNFGVNLDAILSYEKYMPKYPYITNNTLKLKNLTEEYDLDIFVIDKILTDKFYKTKGAYKKFISNKNKIYESERFLVVEL